MQMLLKIFVLFLFFFIEAEVLMEKSFESQTYSALLSSESFGKSLNSW